MVSFKFPIAVVGLLAAGLASAIPAPKQDACAWTCGAVCYDQGDITRALEKGVSLFEAKEDIGSNNYPHQFNNREQFNFTTTKPWYEFPIMANDKVYDGGQPREDRVIFNGKGDFTFLITHRGAGGNKFLPCKKA